MLNYEISKLIEYIYNKYEKFIVFETLKVDEENFFSYFFISPKKELVLYKFKNTKKFFLILEKYLSLGYYLAGFFSYELGYFLDYKNNGESFKKKFDFPLAFFYVFDPPLIFNHKNYNFLGNTKILEDFSEYRTKVKDNRFFITNLNLNVSKEEYFGAIKKIKKYISYGDTYQVNYTIKTKFNFSGALLKFYNFLKQNQKVSYAAFIKTKKFSILSFSPELFFRKIDNLIIMKPMKGTINRGKNVFEDEMQIKKLQNSIKNRAENIMIVDLLRNDLGKISKYGEVKTKKLFEIEKYETLFQMTSTIQAKIDKNINLYKLFRSIFPSGSVTGAPKIRSMQIIKELEKEDRKVYTGAIGFFTPKKNAVFNVAIRTVLIYKNATAEMGIGSGIVSDSKPEKEFEECKLKSMFLLKKPPRFKLVETILYYPEFNKEIKNFNGLKLNITKLEFESGYFLLKYHIERLKNSALYFDFRYKEDEVLEKLNLLSKKIKKSKRIRLLLSKSGKVDIEDYDFNEKEFCSKNIENVILSNKKTNKEDIFLYHKTTHREIYSREYKKFKNKNFFDVLFLNNNNQITETSRGNIFLKINNIFYTPPVHCGLLKGVFREYLFNKNIDKIKEKILTLEDINTAEKIYLTNSVLGIREIKISYEKK